MIRHRVHKAAARERPSTFPERAATPAVLRDGSGVLVRPVRSTDASLLEEGFARLSERSRRMRFLGKQEGICRFTGVGSRDNVPMGMLLRSVGAVETDRSFGTVEYEIALVRAGEYSLDWWFRCVEDGSVLSWR